VAVVKGRISTIYLSLATFLESLAWFHYGAPWSCTRPLTWIWTFRWVFKKV